MRKLTILLMILGLSLWAGMAQAADNGQVAVTYTIGLSLDMSVSPTSWAISSGGTGETKTTFDAGSAGYFTVTNSSNGPAYTDIKASIAGGGSLGSAAGADVYRLGWGQASGSGPYSAPASYTEITTSDANLATVSAGSTYKFDMQLLTPTSTTLGGIQQTITVTITAKTS